MRKFDRLFESLTVRGVTLRNRIVMPAMNNNFANPDGSVSARFRDYYVERGKGGAGLLISAPAYVDPAARKRAGALLLHDDSLLPPMRDFTEAVHATGARIFLQLNHNGRLLSSSKDLKTAVTARPIGPSAVARLRTGVVPHAMTEEEIGKMVELFARTARRAQAAGFDGVELHGAHGYLLHQFFSPFTNRRTDRYGGSLENRMRFSLEIYRRVRELTGTDFLVGYRLNGKDFMPVEAPMEEIVALAQRLEKEGVDLIHVSAGTGETPETTLQMIPHGAAPRGCFADLAAAVKAGVSIPVIAVGRINTPDTAEEILAAGKADLVATGRALICDPYWPQKAQSGHADRIRRCTGCLQGCQDQLVQERRITCLYNPMVGREGEAPAAPKTRKKICVVGGGPAGMEAAAVAAERGHAVELFERSDALGGQALLAQVPPGKQEYAAVGEFLKAELARLKVTVHLGEECSAQRVLQTQPDAVVLATGALPIFPELPGVEGENVRSAWEVLGGAEVGQRVVVVGGGLVGAECALYLAQQGRDVVLIELLDQVAHDVGSMNRTRILQELSDAGVEIRCRTALVGIRAQGAMVADAVSEYLLPAATVVLALGARACNPLRAQLEGKVPEIYAVGDCVAPRKMMDAIHEAFEAAVKL